MTLLQEAKRTGFLGKLHMPGCKVQLLSQESHKKQKEKDKKKKEA